MSALHLTFAGAPSARDKAAAYDLFVSVANGDGTPRTGLTRENFQTWVAVGVNAVDFPLAEVHAADGAHALPKAAGVYLLSFRAPSIHWSAAANNGIAVFVAVVDGSARGQGLHAAYNAIADYVKHP